MGFLLFIIFLLLLLLRLLFFGLIFFGFFFLGLFLLFRSELKIGNKLLLAQPGLAEKGLENIVFHQGDKPFGETRKTGSRGLIEDKSEEISQLNRQDNVSN